MLIPTVANRLNLFYAVGNTPAINLARSVPHGQDADILSLGCGDLRYILYTAYLQEGVAPRKLDITCCDHDVKVIGRNIVLLTLILDEGNDIPPKALWDIYYHLYLDDDVAKIVLDHVQKLLPLTTSLEAWKAGPFATALRICDRDTLSDIGKVLQRIETAAKERMTKALQTKFSQNIQKSKDIIGDQAVLSGVRAAAPLSLKSHVEVDQNFRHYWDHGTVRGTKLTKRVPNPMFSGLLSQFEALHYGSEPLLGFHLATAFADLSEHSPLRPTVQEGGAKMASAAQCQFFEWVKALRVLCRARRIVLRFAGSDVFALCHTLQHAGATGQVSANWYRRTYDGRILVLDEEAYGACAEAPTAFDLIETSNLSDHVGMLNIAVSAGPLLKAREWAVINTDQLNKFAEPDQKAFDSLVCGPSSTVSLLMGLTPFQYWTNAKVESHVDEVYMTLILEKTMKSDDAQLHARFSWRRDDQLGKNDPGRPMLRLDPSDLAKAVFQIYLLMFKNEMLPSEMGPSSERVSTYGHFHRGTFVALLKLIQSRIKTDWRAMMEILLHLISTDRKLLMGSNRMQDLFVQLHISKLYTEAWLTNLTKPSTDAGPFKGWREVPDTVAVNVVIPRSALERLFPGSLNVKGTLEASPTFWGSLKSSFGGDEGWHNMYGDVHLVFGKATSERDASTGETLVKVERDELGWTGKSPLVASFVVPTEVILLDQRSPLVGIYIPLSRQSVMIFGPILGPEMMAFETALSNTSHVLLSKFRPGQKGNEIVCGGAKPLPEEVMNTSAVGLTTLKASLDSQGKISEICAHLNISSALGCKLLSEGAPVELQQKDPFVIDVVFGARKLVCPLRYPIPVTKEGSKTRIARTSRYVEVIAPIATPAVSGVLSDYIMPSVLDIAQGLPVALNASHVNLDRLPIIALEKKEELNWLASLTSFQFSSREQQGRREVDSTGMTGDARMNFKESLFTMFMLSSGLQGGQTGLFKISHPGRGGVHIIILVSALRLDGDTASVVLDAAVIPLTTRMLASPKLRDFLLMFMEMQSATVKVNDEELALWKKVLPAMAERCRTWSHLPQCEYRRPSATVPLSLDQGEKLMCSCGHGKFPDDFLAIPLWEDASSYATRIAVSPTFAVPFVESVVDTSGYNADALMKPGCRKCGKKEGSGGSTLKKCSRCKSTKYCSAECQKGDWKKHKQECQAVS